MLVCVTACTDNEIVYKTGQKPDQETLETVSGTPVSYTHLTLPMNSRV